MSSKNKFGYDKWESIPALKATARELGNRFFDPETMKFFSSELESGIVADQWFITSELSAPFNGAKRYRKYTVRRAVRVSLDSLEIETVGEFMEHRTLEQARAALRVDRDASE